MKTGPNQHHGPPIGKDYSSIRLVAARMDLSETLISSANGAVSACGTHCQPYYVLMYKKLKTICFDSLKNRLSNKPSLQLTWHRGSALL